MAKTEDMVKQLREVATNVEKNSRYLTTSIDKRRKELNYEMDKLSKNIQDYSSKLKDSKALQAELEAFKKDASIETPIIDRLAKASNIDVDKLNPLEKVHTYHKIAEKEIKKLDSLAYKITHLKQFIIDKANKELSDWQNTNKKDKTMSVKISEIIHDISVKQDVKDRGEAALESIALRAFNSNNMVVRQVVGNNINEMLDYSEKINKILEITAKEAGKGEYTPRESDLYTAADKGFSLVDLNKIKKSFTKNLRDAAYDLSDLKAERANLSQQMNDIIKAEAAKPIYNNQKFSEADVKAYLSKHNRAFKNLEKKINSLDDDILLSVQNINDLTLELESIKAQELNALNETLKDMHNYDVDIYELTDEKNEDTKIFKEVFEILSTATDTQSRDDRSLPIKDSIATTFGSIVQSITNLNIADNIKNFIKNDVARAGIKSFNGLLNVSAKINNKIIENAQKKINYIESQQEINKAAIEKINEQRQKREEIDKNMDDKAKDNKAKNGDERV
jgi:DNA repair exonuclease SbcCD ATPase subunit